MVAAPEEVAAATGRVDADDVDDGRDWTVREVIVHPGYDTTTLRYDAALLILDGSDDGPVLPLAGAPPAGTPLALAGWGLTGGGATQAPQLLQQTTLTAAADARCASRTARLNGGGSSEALALDPG